MPIYHHLAQLTLLTQTVEHHNNLRGLLGGAGYTDPSHLAGLQLLKRACALTAQIHAELQSDRAAIHLVHSSTTELEIWLQTARARARRALRDDDEVELLVGAHLHGSDHTLTVMAQALRFLALARNDEHLRASLGNERSVHDLLLRGATLLKKLTRCAEDAILPEHTDAQQRVDSLQHELQTWLDGALKAVERGLAGQDRLMGLVGHTPPHAAPLGGASRAVTLHQRALASQPPSGGPSRPDPSWSTGRQGRNSLNHGKGYNPPRA